MAVDDRSNPQMIQIHLKRSKCDQFGQGADVVVGMTGTEICPVTALIQFIAGRGSTQGPFFHDPDGGTLTKPVFICHLRDVLQSLGIPACQHAGHSFRIGAATTAATIGMENSTIQMLSRWHSAAFLHYVRTPKTRLERASASLVQQPSTRQ